MELKVYFSIQLNFLEPYHQYGPKIAQKTQIKSTNASDQLGVLFYLHRSFSLSEYRSQISVIASSSPDPKFPPENVLFYNGCNWYSSNSPNQFIAILFKLIEVEIESYRLEIRYKFRALGWKVEGRLSSSEEWYLVDKRGNEFIQQNASENDFVAITFHCQNPGRYSEFKITMTSKNAQSNDGFALQSVEFFGTLIQFSKFQ
jgi:hypothetical protein